MISNFRYEDRTEDKDISVLQSVEEFYNLMKTFGRYKEIKSR